MIKVTKSTCFALRTIGIAFVLMATSDQKFTSAEPVSANATVVQFHREQLDSKFRSEGVATGDFNHDGMTDIAAGGVWYAAPNWDIHSIIQEMPEYDPLQYSDSFANFADDINGDGWIDLIVVGRPGEHTVWYENPQQTDAPWQMHVISPVSNNESPQYCDMDGDGRRDLLMGIAPSTNTADGPDRQMAILQRGPNPKTRWSTQVISTKAAPGTLKYSHGLGNGDLNGDGRMDVIVADGWWEAPADARRNFWKFHPIPFGKPVADMVISDFNGDGRADIACSSAHGVGIWWLQQLADGSWHVHEIDNAFSQSHSLRMGDINGDGKPDLVTGKRWWAHGPTGDVQADWPSVLYWYELDTLGNSPTWTPHLIDDNSGIGTQFELADVNGDGLLDIVTANKKGVFLFRQLEVNGAD